MSCDIEGTGCLERRPVAIHTGDGKWGKSSLAIESPGYFKATPRQLEVLIWIASGRGIKKTARILGISKNTVKNHLHDLAITNLGYAKDQSHYPDIVNLAARAETLNLLNVDTLLGFRLFCIARGIKGYDLLLPITSRS